MSPAEVSLVVAAVVFGGSMLTMCAARALPHSQLTAEAREVIKLGMALMATLVALVLGLMVATAKGTYDSQNAAVRQLSADILLLDTTLAEYGPDAQDLRELLRTAAGLMRQRLWPDDGSAPVSLAPGEAHAPMEVFLRKLTVLPTENKTQEYLKEHALRLTTDLAQMRFQMYVQGTSELPTPFVVVVVIWLIVLFSGYGLIAARNATVMVILLTVTLSVSGAVFLVQELANPFGGLIRVSSAPLQEVIAQLGR